MAASGRPATFIALAMAISAGAFLALAALTVVFGEDLGLGPDMATILVVAFVLIAAGDALVAVLLHFRNVRPGNR